MHLSTLCLHTLAALSTTFIPTTTALPADPTNFLLVTTNQKEATTNSSQLKAVSATSLFVRVSPISPFQFLSPRLQTSPILPLLTCPIRTHTTHQHFTSAFRPPATPPCPISLSPPARCKHGRTARMERHICNITARPCRQGRNYLFSLPRKRVGILGLRGVTF
jgi:hypothetical protein